MKRLIKFIINLKSYWKLYRDYGYDGDMLHFILTQYEIVLANRTERIYKPTHCAKDIIKRLDEWYAERSD